MNINEIFRLIQRPEKGWDPISIDYVKQYALYSDECYALESNKIIADIESFVSNFEGLKAIDLAAGPGQYTRWLESKGAHVTWQDISRNYQQIFEQKFPDSKVKKMLCYVDEVCGSYDLIFQRVSWYYCVHDMKFANRLFNLLKPGGKAYLIIPNEVYMQNEKFLKNGTFNLKHFLRQLWGHSRYYLNNKFGIKIGHPFISTQRMMNIFSNFNYTEACFKVEGRETIVKLTK